jgi:hypothetical protein
MEKSTADLGEVKYNYQHSFAGQATQNPDKNGHFQSAQK